MSGPSRPKYAHLLPYTIPNCRAVQIINEVETPLSKGDLTLQLPTVTQTRSLGENSTEPQPILLAFIGRILFPLFKETNFGTFTHQPRQYGFDFRLSKDAMTQVRLILPEDVSVAVQDRFEEILIQSGLLLDGIRAAGDEIMRVAKEGSRLNSEKIQQGTREHIKSTPAATDEDEVKFSKEVHKNAQSVQQGVSKIAEFASSASSTMANAAGQAGSSISQALPDVSIGSASKREHKGVKEEAEGETDYMGDMKQALQDAASGIAEGTTTLASTTSQSASEAIEHGYGKEAKSLASMAGGTTTDVGKSVGNVAHSTSVIGAGISAVGGAQESQEHNDEKETDTPAK